MSQSTTPTEINSKYAQIYSEMYPRNTRLISQGHLTLDPLLSPELIDSRRGVGIFSFGNYILNSDFNLLCQEASSLFKNSILYCPHDSLVQRPEAILHFTFFQIHKVTEKLDQFDLAAYHNVISEVFSQLPEFTINYTGIMAVPSGLLIYGIPSIDINKYRDRLRTEFVHYNLNSNEPYKTNTAHSTIMRFTGPVDTNRLMKFSAKWHNFSFGKMKLDHFSLGYGSWKMLPAEINMLFDYKLKENMI